MSVFAQSPCETAGTAGFAIGWNDQNARCSGVITYGLAVDLVGVAEVVAVGKIISNVTLRHRDQSGS